jgi:hypothetical protein
VVGAVGVGFVAWPFLSTWNPSARAKAAGAPVEGQKLDFANHPYLCKGLFKSILTTTFSICVSDFTCFIAKIAKWVKSGFLMIVPIYAKVS